MITFMERHYATMLQRPPHFDEDGSNGAASEDRAPRGGLLRDILNPVSSAPQQAPSSTAAPSRAHPSSFSLRSPTQSDLHHPTPYSGSPSSSGTGGREPSGPRSILNNPFMSASAPPLPPPPLQAPPVIASSITAAIPAANQAASAAAAAASSSTGGSLQHPPRSPLHAPSVYYSADRRDRDRDREKPSVVSASSGTSFYDPTADAAPKKERERKVSDAGSWRTATQASTPKVSKAKQWRQSFGHAQCQLAPIPNSQFPILKPRFLFPNAPPPLPTNSFAFRVTKPSLLPRGARRGGSFQFQ